MGLGGDAGATGSIHGNIAFREGRFTQNGIGQHTNAGTQTYQFNFQGLGPGSGLEFLYQQGGTEGRLADKVSAGTLSNASATSGFKA